MKINYEFNENENYEYVVDNDELKRVLKKIICKKAKWFYEMDFDDDKSNELINFFVYELDIVEELSQQFYEEIKNYFYQSACDEYWGF